MPKAAGSPSLRSGGTHFSHSSGWCLFKQSDRSWWSSVSPSKKFQKKKKVQRRPDSYTLPSLVCCPKDRHLHSSTCPVSFCLVPGSLTGWPWIETQPAPASTAGYRSHSTWCCCKDLLYTACQPSHKEEVFTLYMCSMLLQQTSKGLVPFCSGAPLLKPSFEWASHSLSYLAGHLAGK